MFFSIIVPVYNVERYLDNCLDSIINQAFQDYEIILVNDGSTDASGRICDQYGNNYNFITTVHKSNGGLDSARKMGLKYSNGEFIIFLDSDDWLADHCLENIAGKLQDFDADIDVIQTAYTIVFPDGRTRDVNNFDAIFEGKPKITGSQFAINNFEKKISMNNVWSKIYRRQYLQKADLPVLPKYSCEDVETLYECVMKGVTYSYLDEKLVMFRSARPGSITTVPNFDYVLGYLQTMSRIIENLKNSNLPDISRLKGCCANMFIEECQYIENFSRTQKKQLYSFVKKNKIILKYLTEESNVNKIYKRIGIHAGNKVVLLKTKIYYLLFRR